MKILNTSMKSFILGGLLTTAMASFSQTVVEDSVIMGTSYANDVFYSMSAGEAASVPRDTWDIAFRTAVFSSSILINEGMGVMLWTYPKSDSSGWNNIDTSGLSTWTPMFNDSTDWENGAFSRNATGHPDYGWGVYNAITHDLYGDSLFIIQLRDQSFRKIFIQRKNSLNSTFYFRFANLDGSSQHDIILNLTPMLAKDFVGYNLQTNQAVDNQPPVADWDLLFTRYISVQQGTTPYIVMGVLSNSAVGVNEYRQVPVTYGSWSLLPWDETRSSIGWDWKHFDMGAMMWTVEDSLVFFVRDQVGDVYRLLFKKVTGSGSGKIWFTKEKISGVGITVHENLQARVILNPNPAVDESAITYYAGGGESLTVKLFDMAGRMVVEHQTGLLAAGINGITLSLGSLKEGLYHLTINNGKEQVSRKLLIQR